MNDPKAAAAYHPGDAPVTRPDLDAIQARADAATSGPWVAIPSRAASGKFAHLGKRPGYIQTQTAPTATGIPFDPDQFGSPFIAEPNRDADGEFIAHAREDIPALLAALAAERAQADQAERDVTNAENYGIRWMKRAQEAEHRIADALSCLRASSVPLGMTEVMFQDRLITEARRVLSVAPTAEQ